MEQIIVGLFDSIYSMLLAISLSIIIFSYQFIRLFTGRIDHNKVFAMFRFCYAFTFFSLVLPIILTMWAAMSETQEVLVLSPLGILKGCVATPEKVIVPTEIDCTSQTVQWLVNIGGSVTHAQGDSTDNKPHYHIHGGLVVPIYVILFAFMGAAVSLMRRIPEIQSDYAANYAKYLADVEALRAQAGSDNNTSSSETETKKDSAALILIKQETSHQTDDDERVKNQMMHFSGLDIREKIIFQIMQMFSAPMIAMTVYYIVEPSSKTTSVVLGFISGFASEPVLVSIRAAADRLMNAVKPPDQSGK